MHQRKHLQRLKNKKEESRPPIVDATEILHYVQNDTLFIYFLIL